MQAVKGDPGAAGPGRCRSCGAEPFGTYQSCQDLWETLLAKSFSELAYGRFHRLLVDLYSLQHPDTFCRSAKSYAAHLTGLCVTQEHAGDPQLNAAVQRWLGGRRDDLTKPGVPSARGALDLTHVLRATDAADVARRVAAWSDDVWVAYLPVQGVARQWIALATGSGR
jgi:hypothetical protein